MNDAREAAAYVAIGSNISPEVNIARALEMLAEQVRITALSTLYRSAPVGTTSQPDFVNGVCAILATMAPRSLKYDVLRPIEDTLGRVRTEDRYGPRTIDLDLVIWSDLATEQPGLRLPDPDIRVRPFLAVPLLEIAPDLVLPDTGRALKDIECAHATQALVPLPELTKQIRTRLGL